LIANAAEPKALEIIRPSQALGLRLKKDGTHGDKDAMTKFKRCACFAVMAFALFAMNSTSRAGQEELEPDKVSESLKALFSYGGDPQTKKAGLNAKTVTIIAGTIKGTHEQIGADLASVLDDGEKFRVLPIMGRGSVQSVADILFLNNVDLGVIHSDSLDYLKKNGFAKNLKGQLTYITKLFNEEMHVVAPKAIEKLADLEGKTVSVDSDGTFITATTVFARLGIKPNFVCIEERRAYEKLRSGEIDAMVAIQGSSSKFMTEIEKNRFHFVPIKYAAPLQVDYLPAQLKSKDYPALIPAGERVDTIAVPTILAAYNWDPGTQRYRKIAEFVDAFFSKFKELQKPPFHSKWKEVVLSAPMKGWKRFPAAKEWLDEHSNGLMSEKRRQFDEFMATRASTSRAALTTVLERNAALYKQFLEWQKETTAKPQSRRSRAAHRHKTNRIKTNHGIEAENREAREKWPQETTPAPSATPIFGFLPSPVE
jgi:TRAP-type uncharacterized transport system substrate-binding protein